MSVKLTKEMIDTAKETEESYGIPSSITLGQIMLESGGSYEGGLSGLAWKYNNLFGITKGSSWHGETVVMSAKGGRDTKEYRVYDSKHDSIIDHAKVLLNSRYTQYTKNAKTVSEYAEGIAKGGYATDKSYADKLKAVIKDNNLTAYDGDSWIGKSGKLSSDDVEETESNNDIKEKDLKLYGDIIVIVLCVLLIGLAVIFFLYAFSGGKIPTPISKAKAVKKMVKG